MENKYLQVKEKSIFTRFFNFIKGIFGKKAKQEISSNIETVEKKEIKSNFFDEIRIDEEKNKELLDLQSKYENNEIDLCVMSDEEIYELNSLYKRQVSDLKKKLEEKKIQLTIMKNRIEGYSENT